MPDAAAKDIQRRIAMPFEFMDPIVEELFVDVVVAALQGDGGRKYDRLRMLDKACDEPFRGCRRQMFSDFEADDDIEALVQGEPRFEIMDLNPRTVANQVCRIEPRTIDSAGRNSACRQSRHPGSEAAADVQSRLRLQVFPKDIQKEVCRYTRLLHLLGQLPCMQLAIYVVSSIRHSQALIHSIPVRCLTPAAHP